MKKGSADDLMPYVAIHRSTLAPPPPILNSPSRINERRLGLAGKHLHSTSLSGVVNEAYTLQHYYVCKIIESRLPLLLHNLRMKKGKYTKLAFAHM